MWVSFLRFRGPFQGSDPYDEDQIGYCKVNGTWGIALRHISGEEPDGSKHQAPAFYYASSRCAFTVWDKIPDVIEALAGGSAQHHEVYRRKKQSRFLNGEASLSP